MAGVVVLAVAVGLVPILVGVAWADPPQVTEVADFTMEEGEERTESFTVTEPDDDAVIVQLAVEPQGGGTDPGFTTLQEVEPNQDFDVTFSPEVGHAGIYNVSVTVYKDIGHNAPEGDVTQRWSEQEGQPSGIIADRNRILGGDHVPGTNVGAATASGSGAPLGVDTAPSERNRNTFTVALAPADTVAPVFEGMATDVELNSALASQLEIEQPVGAEPGDLLLAQIRYRDDGTGPALTTPGETGWTEIDTIIGPSRANHTVFWKFVQPGDEGPYTFDQTATGGRMAGAIAAYSGVNALDPIEASASAELADTDPLEAPALADPVSANARVVRLWGWHGYSATIPAEPSALMEFTVNVTEPGSSSTSSTSTSTSTTSTSSTTSTTSTTTTTTVPTPPPPPPPPPPPTEPEDHFTDDDGHLFEDDINAVAEAGFTRGCNPPDNDRFCPEDLVTRGQMAAFLVRALNLTDDGGGDLFDDDDGHVFEGDIDRLATAGITRGCNPPDNNRFCPDENLTRGQMAAFLVRALGYSDDGGGDLFVDDDDSVFEADIDRLATAGVTRGCNPPANDRFCPDENLTRGQMAAFLARALIYDN